jgi:hypothetical protein
VTNISKLANLVANDCLTKLHAFTAQDTEAIKAVQVMGDEDLL